MASTTVSLGDKKTDEEREQERKELEEEERKERELMELKHKRSDPMYPHPKIVG